MKSLTLALVLASVLLASGASAAPSVHAINGASSKHYCGKDAVLTVSIVAPSGVHGTLRVEPVAAPSLTRQVSYTGNGTSVKVPVTLPGLSCSDVRGIKLSLSKGSATPTWVMPREHAYGVAQTGSSTTTHIQRVQASTISGNTRFEIQLVGGTNGSNLQGTIRVRSVHSSTTQPGERTTTYNVERGRVATHSFGHAFPISSTLTAFHVYLNGASTPLVASRVVVRYGL